MKRAASKSAASAPKKRSPNASPSSAPVMDQLFFERSKRQLLRDALRPNEQRDLAFRRMVLSIPAGKVSTYGAVAAAAGYPRYHRAVARLLRTDPPDSLPWHRVLGAGGEIKLRGAAAHEQRARLKLEGVEFLSRRIDARVDMGRFEHELKPWEVYAAERAS
ncbi:MGMT family protein [Occallatibacter riparius]|uniref:MGMT family protein n=1 Tax=Occallatibacter riparius TaxID=1002689 RepID=A0A9J7BXW3_9BACT|nr:MGMT family protein [Occallatibacter riparius]UWZ86858.1 MGMT family protein [Occallatibacter riparius]